MKMHKKLPTDANTDIVFSLVTPFAMYLLAEEIHASGVLAVVSGGLFLATRSHDFLSSSSRLRGINVWQSLTFVLNGLVFMLIGLDLPQIASGLGQTSIAAACGYGVLITFSLIVIRMLAAYGALFTTLIMRNFIVVADGTNRGLRAPLLLGWTGMRGVVSLAAALSIPLTLADGTAFPQRNLILFITFVVILLTLVIQGLTLPALIKKINMPDPDFVKPEEEIEREIRKELSKVALQKLKTDYSACMKEHPALMEQVHKWEQKVNNTEPSFLSPEYRRIYLDILESQRQWLIKKNKEDALLDEEIIRRHLRFLDLEEEKLEFV